MELKRIFIENFMIHKCTDIDCTKFNSVLIVGNNSNNERVANGVGKSTIFKAIDYALFGEHATKTLDKIIRDGSQKAKVSLEFTNNIGTFRVTRTRSRKGKSELFLEQELSDGSWQSLNQKTPTETELELSKLIKISYSAFKNSVLFSQFDFFNGLAASITSEARKSLLKEILNLVIYSKLEEIAKQHTSNLNKKIAIEKALLKSLGEPKNEIEACEIFLKNKQELLEKNILDKNNIFLNLEAKKKELIILTSNFDSTLDSLKEEFKINNEYQSDLNSNIKKIRDSVVKKNEILSLNISNENKLLNQISNLKKELSEIEEFISANDLKNIQSELDKIIDNESLGTKLLDKQDLMIDRLSVPLPKETVCASCRQQVSPDHLKECQVKINEELLKVKLERTETINKLQILKNRKSKKQEEIKQFNLKLNKKILLTSQIKNDSDNLKSLKMSITLIQEEISNLESELIEKNSLLNSIIVKGSDLLEQIQNLEKKSTKEKTISLKNEILSLENEYKYSENLIQNINLELGILSEKIKSKQSDANKIIVIESEIKNLEKELKIRQIVTRGFSTSGIPSLVIMNTIIDDLQTETNELLAQIRPGLEIKFDNTQEDKLDIIYYVNGLEKDLEQLSGGQRVTIVLALKIGLLFSLQNRLGIDIKFLELDEIDQSLDKATIDAFVNLVKKLQNNFKIFVITHNEDLKSKFSNIISVECSDADEATGRLVTN